MNKLKLALFTVLGISLLYFTSLIFDHRTANKEIVSNNKLRSNEMVKQNNSIVSNAAPTALLTEHKPKSVLRKEIDGDYKNELAEKENEEFENEKDGEEDESQDAPEKAVEQDFERTKDPALNRPTPEVLPGVMLNSAIQSFSGALLGLPGAGTSTSWVQRGPTNVGGRTRALAWDPNDLTGKKVWAGGVTGGLWYNNDITDANSSWVNVGDIWSNLAVTKVVFDPANPQNIYVSTGEGYNVNSTRGAGLWKSTNGGASFSQISNSSGFTYINDIVVRVESGNGVIYITTDDFYYNGAWSFPGFYYGLWKSTNQGNSWTQVIPFNNSTNVPYTISSIAIDKNNGLWVGTKSTPASGIDRGGGKILYSNNGTSWTISKSVAVTNGRGRVTVATAPSNVNYVYAFIEKNTTGGVSSLSLIKSSDFGSTWTDMSLPVDIDTDISASDFTRGQGWYNQVLKVDPNNETTVYIGGIDLFKSTDAGSNWTQISRWSTNNVMGSTARLSDVHADQHVMEFQPGSSSTAVFGNDGGVFYSADLTNASTSNVISSRNKNYNVTQFYAAAIHPSANTNYYLAGAQDNGTVKFTSAGLGATSVASTGDGAYCFIDQTNPAYQITSYVYNNVYRSTNSGGSFNTWAPIMSENTGSFINPATYDNNLHIYYSYKSTDGTNGVIKRITGINATPSVSDVAISGLNAAITCLNVSPLTTSSTTLYIGTSNSKIIKVTNADGTPSSTTLSTTGFPAGASISSIDIGANENELLVTFFNYGVNRIWYTSDGGANWSNKMGNFPNIPARWGMFNPDNRANDVLLATELGIYGTTNFSNANPTWSQMNNGFTNVRTDMLQYRASDKQVIAATYGRGLYSSNGFAVTPSITSFTPTTASTGTTVTITGNDFDAITGVSFGGVAAASYTVTSLTSISAVVAGGASGDVSVTNSAGTGSLAGFVYCAPAAVSLTSGVNSNNQTVCQNTAINSITYSTTNVTGVTITGVPSLTASYNANVVTVSGAPTSAGVYTFTVSFTGGCQTITATGTITVTASNTLALSSAAGTNSQSVCINTPITSITYASTGATTASVTGLPSGVSYSFAANTVTISGTPTIAGTYSYTVTTSGGCGPNTLSGTIVVNPNATISLLSGSATSTICINNVITPIVYQSTSSATNISIISGRLPGGVIGVYNNINKQFTINGTATETGTFTYTIATTGGCVTSSTTGTITVSPDATLSIISGTSSNTICVNSAVTPIVYQSTSSANNIAITSGRLPGGITGTYNNITKQFTISGTATETGSFTFSITSSGACLTSTVAGVIIVNQNTITLSSATGTDSQTICLNAAITEIRYNTTGATNTLAAGLPPGLTGTWSNNVFTITGTPTNIGTYNYVVTTIGGCGPVTTTGIITINPTNTLTLSSGAGTNSRTVCISSAITATTYSTTGATSAIVTGLPTGLTGTWAANVLTIGGTPSVAGTFTYTVTTVGGCGVITATGVFVVNQNTIALTSSTGTDNQTICSGTSITSITYSTTGATGANFNGLPAGLNASWSANTITISGTPTVSNGIFNYTITLTGGCGTVTKTGTIIISFPNTITLGSAAGTNSQTICINTSITPTAYNTTDATGATVTGLPTGLSGIWSNNVYTISGAPTVSGTYTYTVTTTGGCGVASITGRYNVTPANTFTLTSAAGTNTQSVCVNSSLANITYATTGATNVTVTGLPSGVTSAWAANVLTISGTPTETGTFNYTMTTVGGCGPTTATGTITVKRNTITLSSAAGTDSQTVCLNSALTNITFATTGATGATISGLPADVTGSWSGNVYTISGSPSLLGTFNYTITLTGGCDIITKTGVIKVNPASSAGTASAANSSICPGGSASITLTDFTGSLVWQQSTNGTTWTDVTTGTGINSLTYTTEAINANYSYRAKAINGNCSAQNSNAVSITILPTPNAPIISNANAAKFCNGDSVKLSSTIATGLVWYNNDVAINTSSNGTYYAKSSGTYSAKVFVAGCPSPISNVITLDRMELPISPVVSDISLCKDATPVTLNAVGNVGNTVLWYGTNATGGVSSTTANKISTSAIGTTNYYVSQLSALGCESIRAKITVNIYGIPSAPTITRNNTNNLVSSYTYGNTWYREQVKLADTSNVIKPLEQGNYTVKVLVNTCPSSFSLPYFYLNTVTDIANLNQNEFVKIYPNPIVNDLKLNFSLTKYQKVNVAVYSSTTGGKIIDLINKESGMTVDVRNLIAGTYIVIISSNDNKILYTQKIMKL